MWTDGDCHVMSFRNYARDAKKKKKTRSYESLCYKGSGVWIVDESEKVANAHLACANETDEYDDHTFGTVLDGIEVTVHCLCTSPTRLSRNSCIQKN